MSDFVSVERTRQFDELPKEEVPYLVFMPRKPTEVELQPFVDVAMEEGKGGFPDYESAYAKLADSLRVRRWIMLEDQRVSVRKRAKTLYYEKTMPEAEAWLTALLDSVPDRYRQTSSAPY